jgi:hypothetical protein
MHVIVSGQLTAVSDPLGTGGLGLGITTHVEDADALTDARRATEATDSNALTFHINPFKIPEC